MIFADLVYDVHYDDMHAELVQHIESEFASVESGHQGDSWIWIFRDEEKVAIDTFSSMTHQVKVERLDSLLVGDVINHLKKRYRVNVRSEPEYEGHE